MKQPLRPRSPLDTAPTTDATQPAPARPLPPLPHERDQQLGATAAKPDPVVQQAARDIKAGLVNTDLYGMEGMGAEEQQRLLARERADSEAASRQGAGANPEVAKRRKK